MRLSSCYVNVIRFSDSSSLLNILKFALHACRKRVGILERYRKKKKFTPTVMFIHYIYRYIHLGRIKNCNVFLHADTYSFDFVGMDIYNSFTTKIQFVGP